MRSETFALIGVLALVTHAGAYFKGRIDVALEHERAGAAATIAAGAANQQTDQATLNAGAHASRVAVNVTREAAHGRRDIENFRQAPQPGRVGPDALVDPRLARLVLCRVERLRASPDLERADRECASDQFARDVEG
jgi:hypothetical protein